MTTVSRGVEPKPSPPDHSTRFDRLDHLLGAHSPLWQLRVFQQRAPTAQIPLPDLVTALDQLTETELDALEQDPIRLEHWLTPWLGDVLAELNALVRLESLPHRTLYPPARFETGIGGRKWTQIQALAAVVPHEPRPLLEWCSGKGHLGRLLALTDRREVTSLELDGTLCDAGRSLARATGAPQHFVQADALAEDSARWLPADGQAVALHACGDLHARLIHHWVDSDCHRLTLSPCCYHLIAGQHYAPLSQRARTSALRLERIDLQWAVRERVTGGAGVERQRQTERLWRLAFDEWQRELRGEDRYLPLPAFPKKLLSGTFLAFCQWAATTKHLPVPEQVDEVHWFERGQQRLHQVRLAELVGRPFQRPLELWLALDRVLLLEEQGARVELGLFCDRAVTPRNIVIDAERRATATLQPDGDTP